MSKGTRLEQKFKQQLKELPRQGPCKCRRCKRGVTKYADSDKQLCDLCVQEMLNG